MYLRLVLAIVAGTALLVGGGWTLAQLSNNDSAGTGSCLFSACTAALSATDKPDAAACPAANCPAANCDALVCPVSGGKINKEVWAEHNGGKVYLRCGSCKAEFLKTPDKFATKANHQMVLTGQARQIACPITGEACSPHTKIDVAGVDVSFCCGQCRMKVAEASPDRQIDMVFGKGFSKAYSLKEK